MSLILGSHFLAGALLSGALRLGVLLIAGLYWGLLLGRRSAGARTGTTE